MNEIQSLISFEMAIIMVIDEGKPDSLMLYDFFSHKPVSLSKGIYYNYKNSVFEKIIKQGTTLIEYNTENLSNDMEKELLFNHGYRSCMITTLRIQGKVEGILVLCASNTKVFNNMTEFINLSRNSISLSSKNQNRTLLKVFKNQNRTL
jgi:transcriptional regulator with GAF, ATPase, and Fis domain